MKSQRTKKFFNRLPSRVQAQVQIAYNHFKRDPWYPSLEFKCVNKQESITQREAGPLSLDMGVNGASFLEWMGWGRGDGVR